MHIRQCLSPGFCWDLIYDRGVRFPISQPQPRSTFTTLGVTAAVKGTRMKMKLLWIAYASASCVARPVKKPLVSFVVSNHIALLGYNP
jgi:hypothetical protein